MKLKFLTETKNVFIIEDGFTTGGIVSSEGTVLIGCDDRLTPEIIRGLGLPEVTAILCCDHRRSNNAGILNFPEAKKYINENSCDLIIHPELWWENPANRWHIYNVTNDGDILPYGTGAHNVKKITDNEEITIGDVKITALLTPGDTDYSMSFLYENCKKMVFCGGLLWKGGKLPYLYRLTKNAPNQVEYHGFLRGIPVWKQSLDIIARGDILIPYLGGVIDGPKKDVETFRNNIDKLFDSYADISAVNYYFPDSWDVKIKMDRAKEKDFPPYVKHIGGQCNLVISKSGSAIAIDCGGEHVTDTLLAMIESGEIKSVDAMYITHYHDDHVDGCEYFRKHFDCPIYADETQSDILKNPRFYRLPCISPVSVDVTPLADGYSWRWEEFELTSFWFPGQTLYHDALLVKSENESILFAGDSFTPAGIDDYCAYNRNLFLPDEGYFRCIKILRKYMPDNIINQHVMKAFEFTVAQLDYMEANLSERIKIMKDLSPWDNVNYALDEYFVMTYPYGTDNVKISDYVGDVKCETGPHGIRVYIGDVYLG